MQLVLSIHLLLHWPFQKARGVSNPVFNQTGNTVFSKEKLNGKPIKFTLLELYVYKQEK